MQQFTDLLSFVAKGLAQAFVPQILVITLVYWLVWKLFAPQFQRFRIQPVRRAGASQVWQEIKNTFLVILGGVFTSPLIMILQQKGYTTLYLDPMQYGIGYLIFNTIVILIMADAWFYFAHRLMHHPKVYKYIHAIHHQSLDTTPYTTLSFHVLEPILLSGWVYIVIFLFPVSLVAIGINQVLGLFNNIKSHLGYEFYPKFFEKTPLKYLVNSIHHNQHHTRYNGNYGLFFRFWDLLFGTEFDDYDEVVYEVKHRKQSAAVAVDNSKYRRLTISKIVPETPETTSIYFEPEDENFYHYLPGQHLNLRIKVNGKTYDRIFSLSSSPVVDRFLRITVKQHSIVTNHLRHVAQVGDEVQALYPWGDFALWLDSNQTKNYVMIAGGSGISPLYSMVRSILSKEKDSKVTLLYANKSKETATFLEQIEALSAQFPNFSAVNFISSHNRLSKDALAQALQPQMDSDFYLCGPTRLKTAVKTYLKELGIDREKVHEEDFADGFVSFLTKRPASLLSH
jgi:ring-1,2-phenylacetyl-CoA epoxidase subunit PaaE